MTTIKQEHTYPIDEFKPLWEALSKEEQDQLKLRFNLPHQLGLFESLDYVLVHNHDFPWEVENNSIKRVLRILEHTKQTKPSELCGILNCCINETDATIRKNYQPKDPGDTGIDSAISFNSIDAEEDFRWLIWIDFRVPEKTPVSVLKKAVTLFAEKTGLKVHFSGKRLKGYGESEIFITKEDKEEYLDYNLDQDVYKIYIGVDDEDLLPFKSNYPEAPKKLKVSKSPKTTLDEKRIAQLEAELAALKAKQ